MEQLNPIVGPVAVGGVGGSGTRVVAEILRELGLYMGTALNPASDNMWFVLLFKRPRWFAQVRDDNPELIDQGLSIFTRAMEGNFQMQPQDYAFITTALPEIAHVQRNYALPLKLAISLLQSGQPQQPKQEWWGWKEPNTHIYLKHLIKYFSGLKYIHVMRNGLDMAFSKNQAQLLNWGPLYGVDMPKTREELPRASLNYWTAANDQAIKTGAELDDRFLLLKFEDLCASPHEQITGLVNFLGADASETAIDRAALIPRMPHSVGRFKTMDLNVFQRGDVAYTESLGYPVTAD